MSKSENRGSREVFEDRIRIDPETLLMYFAPYDEQKKQEEEET